MKNFSKILFGLGVAVAMTGCASEEVVNPNATTDITVSVATEAGIMSRALATVDGYELKCVMQLIDDNGAMVGQQATADAAAGKASFVIKAADLDAGATAALFWAEYVPQGSATKVYNSADLTNISYNVTDFNSADANLMGAADAFAGTISVLTNGASVTLTRPMIQFNFVPTNPEAAAGATSLTVAYNAPSAFNVYTGNCDAAASQALVYTNASFNPTAKGNWFTSLIFAPANMSKFEEPITMTLGGAVSKNFTIPAGTLVLDANYIVNTRAEISVEGGEDETLNVEVNINGSYENEPKPLVFEVGAFVNAAGEVVADEADAVGIVYHVGALEGDDASLYPAEYAGKTIKGYIVAKENISAGRNTFNAEFVADGLTPCEGIINGTQNSATVLAALGNSAFKQAWDSWTAANALTNTTDMTAWYLPARFQMEAWMSMIMVTTNLKNETLEISGSEAFRALFPLNTIFDRHPFQNCMYGSCSVNSGGNVQGASLTATEEGTNGTVKFAQIDIKTKTQSVLGRAMATMFN